MARVDAFAEAACLRSAGRAVRIYERTCEGCGATYRALRSDAKYCSTSCRTNAYRQRTSRGRRVGYAERACEGCGSTYKPVRFDQRHCRKGCRPARVAAVVRICQQCRQAVLMRWQRKYCSKDCERAWNAGWRARATAPPRDVECEWCGTTFATRHPDSQFCTARCRLAHGACRARRPRYGEVNALDEIRRMWFR